MILPTFNLVLGFGKFLLCETTDIYIFIFFYNIHMLIRNRTRLNTDADVLLKIDDTFLLVCPIDIRCSSMVFYPLHNNWMTGGAQPNKCHMNHNARLGERGQAGLNWHMYYRSTHRECWRFKLKIQIHAYYQWLRPNRFSHVCEECWAHTVDNTLRALFVKKKLTEKEVARG